MSEELGQDPENDGGSENDHDPEIHNLLVNQLGELGAAVLALALSVRAGRRAGSRTETAHRIMHFSEDQTAHVLDSLKVLFGNEPSSDQETPRTLTVCGVLGSGFAGMNPAYVLAIVDLDQHRLGVAAHAKEGLIKQRTAEKAVAKVFEALPL